MNPHLIRLEEEEVERLRKMRDEWYALAAEIGESPVQELYDEDYGPLCNSLADRFQEGITQEEARGIEAERGGAFP